MWKNIFPNEFMLNSIVRVFLLDLFEVEIIENHKKLLKFEENSRTFVFLFKPSKYFCTENLVVKHFPESPKSLRYFVIVCEQLTVTNFLFLSPSPAHQFITTKNRKISIMRSWRKKGKKIPTKASNNHHYMLLLLMGKQWELNFTGFSHPSIHSSNVAGATTKYLSFTNTNNFPFLSNVLEKKLFDKKTRTKAQMRNSSNGTTVIRSEICHKRRIRSWETWFIIHKQSQPLN